MESANIKAFPKIFHIGDSMIQNLFKGKVEITEKIDGSQFAFGVDENGLTAMRSHGQDLTNTDVPKMFKKAEEQVERIAEILQKLKLRNIYFYCEYLEKPHHNTLTYSRIPTNNLYLFGMLINGEWVSDYAILYEWADKIEIERPHVFADCEIRDLKDLEEYLKMDSILGNTKVEGIVVKNYNEPSTRGSFFIPISMGKYVNEKFKEKHDKLWSKQTSKGKLELFVESFRTEARWQKAIQHLKENDELENAPRDIAKLMKEIDRDIKEEELENIKDSLVKIILPDINRKAKAGLAEYYKKRLLDKAFMKGGK